MISSLPSLMLVSSRICSKAVKQRIFLHVKAYIHEVKNQDREKRKIPHHQEFARQYGNERVYQSNIFFSFIQIGEEYRPVNVSLRKIIVSQYR